MPWLNILVFCFLLLPSIAHAEGRVALLIGNSAYRQPELRLKNPRNDARALGAALRAEGFEVSETLDGSLSEMRTALNGFAARSRGAGIALFFYAGHGVQMSGDNFFLGVDFDAKGAGPSLERALTMTEVRQALERAGAEASVIVIDACRNTPFAESGAAAPGLVRARGGAGLLIAYATDPGNVALDGAGENSVFTRALLDNIDTPGLDVRLMFGRVRQKVVLETAGLQVPWVEEALLGEFVLSADPPADSPRDAVEEEVRRWRQIAESARSADFETYLRDFPDGVFAGIARERIGRLAAGSTPDSTAGEVLLASADRDGVAAALTMLGLLSRGVVPDEMPGELPDHAVLTAALSRYGAELPPGEIASIDTLYADATRTAMILGAATAQRIRTDIVALRSVERAMVIAREALSEVEAIVADNPAAMPVLAQSREDFAAIEASRATILRRLDQSRAYYQSILARAAVFVPDSATVELLGAAAGTRAVGGVDTELRRNAGLFLNHVRHITPETEGSYAWLGDFAAGS
ncbi:caspase family protein [Tropicimonas sp.]|uniref:caspase family protein n=1 Tax=Tropicimonas sp. TaxID=2067044 RepID=UPI003A8A28EB